MPKPSELGFKIDGAFELASDEDPPGLSARSVADVRLGHVDVLLHTRIAMMRVMSLSQSRDPQGIPMGLAKWEWQDGLDGSGLATGPSVAVQARLAAIKSKTRSASGQGTRGSGVCDTRAASTPRRRGRGRRRSLHS